MTLPSRSRRSPRKYVRSILHHISVVAVAAAVKSACKHDRHCRRDDHGCPMHSRQQSAPSHLSTPFSAIRDNSVALRSSAYAYSFADDDACKTMSSARSNEHNFSVRRRRRRPTTKWTATFVGDGVISPRAFAARRRRRRRPAQTTPLRRPVCKLNSTNLRALRRATPERNYITPQSIWSCCMRAACVTCRYAREYATACVHTAAGVFSRSWSATSEVCCSTTLILYIN